MSRILGILIVLISCKLVVNCSEMYDTKNIVTVTISSQAVTTTQDTSQLLIIDPPYRTERYMHSKATIRMNVSDQLYNYAISSNRSRFFIGVRYNMDDIHLVNMIKVKPLPNVFYTPSIHYNLKYHLFWPLQLDNDINALTVWYKDEKTNMNAFQLFIDSIGYPKIELHVIEMDYNNKSSEIIKQAYQIQIIRNYRTVDLGFTIAITIIGTMNTFAIGCMTDGDVLRSQLKKSIVPVCIASGTQYIAVPLLAFGLVKVAQILPELGVGILICSCVPGGGLGHLIVVITGTANRELSVAINFLHIIVTMVTAPLWLFSLGQFLPNGYGLVEIQSHFMMICLVIMVLPYSAGVLLKRFKPDIAEGILNWLVKPILLLFMILFVTLGLYINVYVLGVLDKLTLIIAGMIPSLGYCIGGGLTLLARQGKPFAKSVAIEAAIMNCLAVVAVIKYTMPQPDCDMAIAGAMAVLFSTPLPFIGLLIFHKAKKKVLTYFENRRFEKEQQETILKSFAVITQNALQISGMTPNQIAERRADENQNVDNTLLYLEAEAELIPSVAQLQNDSSVETVPLTQTNHRNYL